MPWGPTVANWQPGRLAWVDLESTATTTPSTADQSDARRGLRLSWPGPAIRTGVAFPTWSHDGESIVYVSVACPDPGHTDGCGTQDGRLDKGAADLYEVPYANGRVAPRRRSRARRAPTHEEYYPAFSPDDKLIAFTRVPSGEDDVRQPKPPRCSSFPTRAPRRRRASRPTIRRRAAASRAPASTTTGPSGRRTAPTVGNKTYYWLIFSSNRYGLPAVTTSSNGDDRRSGVAALHHRRRRGPDGR